MLAGPTAGSCRPEGALHLLLAAPRMLMQKSLPRMPSLNSLACQTTTPVAGVAADLSLLPPVPPPPPPLLPPSVLPLPW